jgi:hypothetical protein
MRWVMGLMKAVPCLRCDGGKVGTDFYCFMLQLALFFTGYSDPSRMRDGRIGIVCQRATWRILPGRATGTIRLSLHSYSSVRSRRLYLDPFTDGQSDVRHRDSFGAASS